MNSADVLALLSFLEDQQHNRYGYENDNINAMDYAKPIYRAPYATDFDLNNDNVDMGEWWNENIEPSSQYNVNPYGHFEPNGRERFAPKGTIFSLTVSLLILFLTQIVFIAVTRS